MSAEELAGQTVGTVQLGTYEQPDGTFVVAVQVFDLDGEVVRSVGVDCADRAAVERALVQGRRVVARYEQAIAAHGFHCVRMASA